MAKIQSLPLSRHPPSESYRERIQKLEKHNGNPENDTCKLNGWAGPKAFIVHALHAHLTCMICMMHNKLSTSNFWGSWRRSGCVRLSLESYARSNNDFRGVEGCPLLALPVEIRRLILTDLFRPFEVIHITARPPSTDVEDDEDTTSWPADQESFAIARHTLHSQLLATCKQIHAEGLPVLYSLRTFDLTARESLKLLLHNIGATNFSSIRHVVLDWDALQDFAWSISKPDYAAALSGLHVVEMATWRNRHIDTTGTRWRNVKGYERMMCQAAADILHKHENLKILAEERFVRKGSVTHFAIEHATDESGDKLKQVSVDIGPRRVKWRFLECNTTVKENEIAIEIEKDLEKLGATQDEANDGGFQLSMIDPF